MRRPEDWIVYWMQKAHQVATRSKDPSFQAGSVIVARDGKRSLSEAYNGPPPSISDDFDWSDRELKRSLVCHAESNALWFAAIAHGPDALVDATLYVNGRPCSRCAIEIARAELGHVIWDDLNPSQPVMVDEVDKAKTNDILRRAGVELIPYSTLKGTG